MGLYQRRRPSPIQTWPTRVRRQDGEESPESSGIASPDSSGVPSPSGSSSPKSPGSPKSSELAPPKSSFSSTSIPLPTQTAAPPPPQVSLPDITTATPQSTATSSPSPPPPTLPLSTELERPRSSSTVAPAPTTTLAPSSSAEESPVSSKAASSAPPAPPILSQSQGSISTATSQSTALPLITGASSSFARRPASSPPGQTVSSSPSSSLRSSVTGSSFVPAQSELDGERSGIGRHRNEDQERPILSKGAEAAAITLSIMGFIALIVGIGIFFKRRRRRQNEYSMRHAEDAFNPNNNGSLHAPETAHVNYDGPPPSLAHMTKSSTSSTGLFAGAHYERPETVSTRSNASRMQAGPNIVPSQPTPNPFADPPRNKAYDQLRGRPRSTTLTDRGSWVKNPFKDPASERFDPFGELQAKARAERRKYVEEARQEAEDRRQREEERGYLEKERMGLEVPVQDARKGSDVTVGGMGVLDRSGDGRWT